MIRVAGGPDDSEFGLVPEPGQRHLGRARHHHGALDPSDPPAPRISKLGSI